jgi:hypothetical protein
MKNPILLSIAIAFIGISVGIALAMSRTNRNTIPKQQILTLKQPDLPQLKTNKEHDMQVDICKYDVIAYLRKDGTLVGCVNF